MSHVVTLHVKVFMTFQSFPFISHYRHKLTYVLLGFYVTDQFNVEENREAKEKKFRFSKFFTNENLDSVEKVP